MVHQLYLLSEVIVDYIKKLQIWASWFTIRLSSQSPNRLLFFASPLWDLSSLCEDHLNHPSVSKTPRSILEASVGIQNLDLQNQRWQANPLRGGEYGLFEPGGSGSIHFGGVWFHINFIHVFVLSKFAYNSNHHHTNNIIHAWSTSDDPYSMLRHLQHPDLRCSACTITIVITIAFFRHVEIYNEIWVVWFLVLIFL